MNCPDCRDRLQQWLDGLARGPAAPDGPPPLCPACADWDAAARRLDSGLRLLAAPTPPAALAGRIVAGVAAERRRRRFRLVLAAGAAAAAASLLFAVGRHLNRGVPAPLQPTQPPPVVRKAAPSPEPHPTLSDSMAQARSAVEALTTRTADETVAQTKLLLPVVPEPSLGSLDPPARSLRETGEGVSAGLEPVADSARRAVGLFLRELPPVEARPKTGL